MERFDIVMKGGDFDKGEIGIVLDYFQNSLGNDFVSVMLSTGKIKTWYAKYVQTIIKYK
tara:strand:+ start:406 stop:582 length:177 start_codon:yes stop_codon:yes gene_type:complete